MSERRAREGATLLAVVLTALALGALVGAAFMLADSQDDQRRELRERYGERTRIASALVGSLFQAAFVTQAQESGEQFGREVSRAALDREVKVGNLVYSLVLDARGRVLGSSSRTPPAAEARLRRMPPFVRAALRPPGYGLSDVEGDAQEVVESAIGFPSSTGPRVRINASRAQIFRQFLNGTLVPIGAGDSRAFILDGKGAAVGAAAARDRTPTPAPELVRRSATQGSGSYLLDGEERYFAGHRLPQSGWRVVASVPEKVLYESVSGASRWLPWALLGLGAAALLAIGVLLRSVARASGRLRGANAELEVSRERLEERAAELERSNSDLQQFAYAASHDLSEPLRTVAGFSQMLGNRYRGRLDGDADEFIAHMNAGVDRMQQLIDDLLLYSRVGRAPLKQANVDLDDVLEQVLEWIGPAIRDRDAKVTSDPLPTVYAERGQLAQVLQNLVVNGIKFTAPDTRPEVHVSAEPEGEQWRICVRDNGIGVDAGNDVIFKMFGRLHPAQTYPGTGIGLALAKRIVERHGGRIWVEPADGGGSVFCFTVPAGIRVPSDATVGAAR